MAWTSHRIFTRFLIICIFSCIPNWNSLVVLYHQHISTLENTIMMIVHWETLRQIQVPSGIPTRSNLFAFL